MAFCENCGAEECGRFRQKCCAPADAPGIPPPGVNPTLNPLPTAVAPSIGMTDNMAGALCYLFGFITGILFLVLAPYNQNRNIRFHAFQSIFLNIAWVALWIVITIILIPFRYIPFLGLFIAIVLQFVLGLGGFIAWLYMMCKTYNGEKDVLP